LAVRSDEQSDTIIVLVLQNGGSGLWNHLSLFYRGFKTLASVSGQKDRRCFQKEGQATNLQPE
jgi:hypothetical protein